MCYGKESNLWFFKVVLRSFEMISGLRVNFSKSNKVGINVEERILRGDYSFLSCSIGNVPLIKSLGILVGGNPKRVSTWQPILDTLKSQLSIWKLKLLVEG